MAPREVIHNFPDSSIAYDFDSSISGAMIFHDGTTAMNVLTEDGDEVSNEDDAPGFLASIQSLTTGAPGASASEEDAIMASLGSTNTHDHLTVYPDAGLEGGISFSNWHGLPSIPASLTDRPTNRDVTTTAAGAVVTSADPLSIDATDIQQEPWKFVDLIQRSQASVLPNTGLNDEKDTRNSLRLINQYTQYMDNIRSTSMGSGMALGNQDTFMTSHLECISSSSPELSPNALPKVEDDYRSKQIARLRHVKAGELSPNPFHANALGFSSVSSLFDEETLTSNVPEMDTTQESTNEDSDFSNIESPPRMRGHHASLNANNTGDKPPLNMTHNLSSSQYTPRPKLIEDSTEETNMSPIRRPMLNAIEIPSMDHTVNSYDVNACNANSRNYETNSMVTPLTLSRRVSAGSASSVSTSSQRSLHWNGAFDIDSPPTDNPLFSSPASVSDSRCIEKVSSTQQYRRIDTHDNKSNLFFDPYVTTVSDLKSFAERGLVVPVLQSLNTPRLKTLGTRMLADYAKMPQRRVAVASNHRILEFCRSVMVEPPSCDDMGIDWPAREYAVETIRSLTATEESDSYLMRCPDLLQALAIVSCGGPLVERSRISGVQSSLSSQTLTTAYLSFPTVGVNGFRITTNSRMGLVSGKARLHACIALMNLSCGKSNKVEIASLPDVLGAMRDVMVSEAGEFIPPTSSPIASSTSTTSSQINEEARLKAVTCIKNLSNADANDSALLGMRGLVEALGYAAIKSCSEVSGATVCTTNACLALMNLSIAKANKHEVFRTPGVMEALMAVVVRTSPKTSNDDIKNNQNAEARIKACSALSNLAIGYDNKVPMFEYPGFVKSILHVIDTDDGEARTKACSILWSFAAEMKNQVPVSCIIFVVL